MHNLLDDFTCLNHVIMPFLNSAFPPLNNSLSTLSYEDLLACLLWTDTHAEAHIERWQVSCARLIIKFCDITIQKTAI